ncbi:MAG TPA: helix-turn-helix domain-containing protein [Gaiellaceae bacterium]|nr:helix-turn-helix domain-containing protein [Gaiellaceae bacterium]
MKTSAQRQARILRSAEGRSVKEIAKLVGISQSSASVWVRDIELTDEQREALIERARLLRNRSRSAHFRERRLVFQEEGRALARLNDPRHATGCMLYWAEGSKSRNAVQFVNSDPAMARYFVQFLRTQFLVPDEAFRLDCNLFADHIERQREIEQFWLNTLALPVSCLRKSTVNVYSKYSQKKRKNRLPYGTVRVCVHSTRVVQSIYGAIQEYGGFERPEWLG